MPGSGQDADNGPSLFVKGDLPVIGTDVRDDTLRDDTLRDDTPRPDATPSDGPEPTVAVTARLRYPLRAVLGLAALVAVAVLRIAAEGHRLAATPLEARLVDAAYPLARLSGSVPPPEGLGEWLVGVQLATYAAATDAFGRYADVLGGARELAVVLSAVLLAAVVAVLRELGTPAVATAVSLALLVVCEPAITVVAILGPGLSGAAWAAVGAVLVLRSGPVPRIAGAVVVLVGVATAPLLAVPLSVLVAASSARRRAPAALVALSVGAAVLVVEVLSSSAGERAGGPVGLVVVVAAVLAVGGLLVPRLRGTAWAAFSALIVVAVPWSPGETLRPAVVVAAVLLAAGLVHELDRRTAHRSLPSPWRLGALVGVITVLAVTVAVTVRPVVARPSPHLALADWIRSETDPSTALSVPDGVRADLLRDGVPAARLAPEGTLAVSIGEPAGGTVLARFGTPALTLAVSTPGLGVSDAAARVAAGEQLARNPNLVAPPGVLAAVRTGSVDTRLLVVLAGLASRGRVVVRDLPAVAGEDPSVPRHRMELAGVTAPTTGWLRAQQPPFAPVLTGAPDTPSLSWPLPAPSALLGR